MTGVSIVFLTLLLYFIVIPSQIKIKNVHSMGPDFMPKLMIGVFGICGIIMILKNLGAMKGEKGSNLHILRGLAKYWPQVVLLLLLLIYLIIMPMLGFVISSMIFLFFLLWYFGESNAVKNIIVSVIYVLLAWYVFTNFFKISFPKGILGF